MPEWTIVSGGSSDRQSAVEAAYTERGSRVLHTADVGAVMISISAGTGTRLWSSETMRGSLQSRNEIASVQVEDAVAADSRGRWHNRPVRSLASEGGYRALYCGWGDGWSNAACGQCDDCPVPDAGGIDDPGRRSIVCRAGSFLSGWRRAAAHPSQINTILT